MATTRRKAARRSSKTSTNGRARKRIFAPRMPLGAYLFSYLHHRGVRHSFGVPGDFVLPTFAHLQRSPIESVTMTHEPGAGFAADAYSRLIGIGLVCVTYCVGGLNVVNAIAGAFAEKSPIVVVSGAPGRNDREKDPLLHHKVKTFDTQRRVYDEVTVATTQLFDEQTAASEISRCIEACRRHKRPVYIEVPYDIVDKVIPTVEPPDDTPPASDPEVLDAALAEVTERLDRAKKPVLLAGVELHRFGQTDLAVRIAEKFNLPVASDLLSKSAVAEKHPLYLGVYGGAMSSEEHVRAYVENADLVFMLGTFITDMSMGIYTARLDRTKTVLATTEQLQVGYHRYDDVQFVDFLKGLESSKVKPKKFTGPKKTSPKPLARAELTDELTMGELMRVVGLNLDEKSCVISDVGDGLFGALGIKTAARAEFIAPAYYLSMGFAVPAGIGVEVADPSVRPFVLVGDGAFQMTGTELSTAVRLGLKPIVIILNNDGYGTMRKIRDGEFNVISRWNYGKICELVGGGEAMVAHTKGELDGAIKSALGSNGPRVIDARLPRDDMSPQLANMTREMAKMRNPQKQ